MSRRLTFSQLAFREQPLFYLLVALICGMSVGSIIFAPNRLIIPLAGGILAGAFWLLIRRSRFQPFLLCGGIFILGIALWGLDRDRVGPDRLKALIDSQSIPTDAPVEIWGTLSELPELAPGRIYLRLDVTRLAASRCERRAAGTIRLVVPLNDRQERIDYDRLQIDEGDQLRVYCHLRRASSFRNPGVRSFDNWLEDQDLDAVGIIKSPLLIERIGPARRQPIFRAIYRFRAAAISTLLTRISPPTSGLLVAALFGNRFFIDQRLGESFRAGGTFHLLVISGLHIAIIAALLLWIATRLIHTRLVRYLLTFTVTWIYVLMVGAQPSVTRAGWMMTMALFGRLLLRPAAGPNALAAAAFALLLWRPRELLNPSFQLSFLTVALIVFISAPIYQRLKSVGEWQPTGATPYPPHVPTSLKYLAEILFWDESRFRREMSESPIRYRLDKASSARWFGALKIQPLLAWAATTLLTTISVQIGLLPIMIIYFHRVSLSSPIANLVEGALIFGLMFAGVLFLCAEAFIVFLAPLLITITHLLGQMTWQAAGFLATWPAKGVSVPDRGLLSFVFYTVFFALLCGFVLMLDRWNPFSRRVRSLTPLFILSPIFISLTWGMVFLPSAPDFARGRLSLTFLDVGQGDAIVIAFPQGQIMSLDCGGRPSFGVNQQEIEGEPIFIEDRAGIGARAVAPFLWQKGVQRIDHLAASHSDADHVQGFSEIARDFPFETAISAAIEPKDPFPAVVAQARPRRRQLWRGDRLEIEGAVIDVLAPFVDRDATSLSSNNRSLVWRLTYGGRRFLLTGDIERAIEARLTATVDDLRADVLKIAHHGSRTSSTAEFLARVSPVLAVISVASPSPYGHPHPDVLARLETTGARLFTTSRCGAITISTDGNDLQVETFTNCK